MSSEAGVSAVREPENFIAVIGHRSPKTEKTYDCAIAIVKSLVRYAKTGKDFTVLTTGNIGFDDVLNYQLAKSGLKYIINVPYEISKKRLLNMYIEAAQDVYVRQENPPNEDRMRVEEEAILFEINTYIINKSSLVNVYLDSRTSTLTYHSFGYAKEVGKKLKNWYPKKLQSLV